VVPVRVWFIALFAWVYRAAAVAVPNLTESAYKRRGQTRERDQMSLKIARASRLLTRRRRVSETRTRIVN